MKKTAKLFSYIIGMVVMGLAMASCQSNETRQLVKAADPGETIIIDRTTTTKLEVINKDTKSGMNNGYSWVKANGIFETVTASDISGIPDVTKVGGISRSDGRILRDTVDCGEQFVDPVFTLADNPATTDITTTDSIGAKTTKVYTANDGKDGNGQELTLEDLYKYLKVDATLPTPHYEPSSSVTGVRYDYETGDENVRIVWVKVQVDQQVVGTIQGDPIVQQYEVGYVQTKDAAVTPVDPLRIKMNILEMFRTYRKRDQHSIMDMWMSFDVINAKTGVIVDNIDTDSRMAAKVGHFGAPSNGYSLEEKRLIGSAPTEVTEELDPTNEEAKAASKQMGKFNFKVECYKQQYYLRFPVRGRDDSEGGKEAGGERLLFQLNGSYVDPAMDYTFNFQITHKTDVVIKGWQEITPSYQRPNDPGIRYEYLSSYVVEFVDHLYLNGEEIVWTETSDGVYYHLVPSKNGKNIEVNNPDYELYYTGSDAHPFHTSTMVVDGWKPIVE